MSPVPRRAVTLVEILIAAALLATITAAMMQLLTVTQRQVVSSETLMNTAMLSQLVIDRIKGNVAANPRWFRDVMGASPAWTSQGTIVDPKDAVNPAGLKMSPFAEHLFAREAPDLQAPINQVAIARATAPTATGLKVEELASLVDSFRDAQVTVQIAHDVDLTSATPSVLAELVKRVTVTVARSSVIAAKGKDPLAFTVTCRMPTPSESLSDAAYDALCARFEPPTLKEQHDQYLAASGSNTYLTAVDLSDAADLVVADAFLILACANNEWLLVQGKCIPGSEVLGAAKDAEYLDTWIDRLEAAGVKELSSSKREGAHLRVRRAGTILGAFKRMRLPMQHFIEEVAPPATATKVPLIPRIQALNRKLSDMLATIRGLEAQAVLAMNTYRAADGSFAALDATDPANAGAASVLQARMGTAYTQMQTVYTAYDALLTGFANPNPADQETITLASLLQQFFVEPAYAEAAARPTKYVKEFSDSLAKLSATLIEHLDQPTSVTAAERSGAAKLLVETATVLSAADLPEAPAAVARLKSHAAAVAPRMAELKRYIEGSEAMDTARARARHARFVRTVADLRTMTASYKAIVDYFAVPVPPATATEPALTIRMWEELCGRAGGKTDGKSITDLLKKLMDDIKAKS